MAGIVESSLTSAPVRITDPFLITRSILCPFAKFVRHHSTRYSITFHNSLSRGSR